MLPYFLPESAFCATALICNYTVILLKRYDMLKEWGPKDTTVDLAADSRQLSEEFKQGLLHIQLVICMFFELGKVCSPLDTLHALEISSPLSR